MLLFHLALYLFNSRVYGVTAAPLSARVLAPQQDVNITALNTEFAPGWVSGPSGRGTWTILYSSIFTLVLCVYTAIHLNLPSPYESSWDYWVRKIKWVLVGVFSAEVVVYTAFEQWYDARKLLKQLREKAELAASNDTEFKKWYHGGPPRQNRFDMTYAHYALMGGMAVDIEPLRIHNALSVVTITPAGLLFLADNNFFCRITPKDIEDKSKADMLAKGLVCLQVLWVAGQAIERRIAHYPTTILEVHVLVNVVCAVIIYMLWVRKPLNIQVPTMVAAGDRPELWAFMVQASYRSISDENESLTSGFLIPRGDYNLYSEPEMRLFLTPNVPPGVELVENAMVGNEKGEINSTAIEEQPRKVKQTRFPNFSDFERVFEKEPIKVEDHTTYMPNADVEVVTVLSIDQTLPSGIGVYRAWNPEESEMESKSESKPASVSFSAKDIHRFSLVSQFVSKYDIDKRREVFAASKVPDKYRDRPPAVQLGELVEKDLGDLLVTRAPNLSGNMLDGDTAASLGLALAVASISAAYGGIHVTALSIVFPTPIEQLLWKISCYSLVGFPGIIIIITLPAFYDSQTNHNVQKTLVHFVDFLPKWILELIGTLLGLALVLGYFGARTYIVIEAFISLRHVPIGVYQSPAMNIMENIPHL